MSSYTSSYPEVPFDPAFKQFFQDFYRTSDTPDIHDEYVQHFTKDATLIYSTTKVQGSEQILALRKGLWEKVSVRKHDALQIYPFGPDSNEVMLHGTVDFELKDGGEKTVDWAAHAKLVKEDGKVKMEFYQVYLPTTSASPSSK